MPPLRGDAVSPASAGRVRRREGTPRAVYASPLRHPACTRRAMDRTPDPTVPTAAAPWLVADIGGSNARFGWVDSPTCDVRRVATLAVARHAGPADAARAYLADIAAQLGAAYRAPRRAALAVATVVGEDRIALTNSPWAFSVRALQRDLALDELRILNDFEALALALPHLGAAQLRAHGALPSQRLPRAVIGPGTGLGVAGVVPYGSHWIALPAEGGHVTLAPADDFESALLAAARQQWPHVSAERLLSGIGLPTLHAAVAAVAGAPAPQLAAEAIVTHGVAGSDALCRRTLEVFCSLLGGFAGNAALTLGARGGVYIAGGIVPRMADLFFASRFRERFEAKGRLQGYLAAIPTALVIDTLAALTGAAAALQDSAP